MAVTEELKAGPLLLGIGVIAVPVVLYFLLRPEVPPPGECIPEEVGVTFEAVSAALQGKQHPLKVKV